MAIEKSILKLESIANSLDYELASELSESLSHLVWVLGSNNLSPGKKVKVLRQLNTYLNKKANEFDPKAIADSNANLRKIRNDLAHGKIRRDTDFASLYPAFWKAVTRLGAILGANEIENLLAYSLRVENMNLTERGATPTKIVSVYRPIFNTLEPDLKKKIFVDLLLRMFSDNDSIMLLNMDIKM